MDNQLKEIYQQVILDHNKNPRNFREIENATHSAEGYNPLCGDQMTVYLTMDGDKVSDVAFQGKGCAISKSSASIMTSMVKGKTKAEAEKMFENFHDLVTGKLEDKDNEELGKLAVFKGVKEFPTRVKCASLAWHTLKSAISDKDETVTTE